MNRRNGSVEIPKRILGKTGVEVTVLGLGGEGALRTFGNEPDAYRLINKALDLGINYCESARAYSGSESYYGSALKERRKQVFLTSKSHARDRAGAMDHLRQTLSNMNTEWLDLWQVHDVRTELDLEMIFRRGGAIEAFAEAKQRGIVRFVGVTGHHDPEILIKALDLYDFDTVLIPINPGESARNGFINTVLPAANKKGMGVIGMKVYFRGLVQRLSTFRSMEPFLHFALSQPITTAVVGCDSLAQVEDNVGFAQSFAPMGADDMNRLVQEIAPVAARLMYYKP
jgi:predicted aldo/keto reductase-like oxidoreductase